MPKKQPGPHELRVRKELQDAGVSKFGLMKAGQRYLHNIIGPDEHIQAVAYGRYNESSDLPLWSDGTLAATEARIIFLDRKPGYTRIDNIPYSKVAGVEESRAPVFDAISLFTGLGQFHLRFVRRRCADQFVRYVEERQFGQA